VVSKTAWEHGLKVVDDPDSIRICANKIHQYKLFDRFNIPHIQTIFLGREELYRRRIQEVFEVLGKPVVIKAPYTNFSKYVEKASCEASFRKVAKRFFRRSDFIVVQRFTPTSFDWRIGVLNGQVLYACKYMMPRGTWKHGVKRRGKPSFIWGRTIPLKRCNVPQKLKEIAVKACSIIGRGLYGVDVKEVNGDYLVVEVNDNPTILSGYEDRRDKDVYEKIIRYLAD